jgi:DNA-binding response OmpR family regulator
MDSRDTVILCVDDDPNTLELLTDILESVGFSVLVAENGFDALALAFSKKPSLILLDLLLPDISGEEICRRLRSHAPTALIPIIMLTVQGEETQKVRGFELGADDYVTKPFSAQILVARIRAVLRRSALNADSPA